MSIFSAGGADAVNQRLKADQAARGPIARRAARLPQPVARDEDELLLSVEDGSDAGPVRSLKDNANQETADDREQQDHYNTPHQAPEPPRLDVQG